MLTILFDGVAYGMLLFILAVGLSVTMGLMNFINLAHGAFAMAGGYLTVVLMQRFQVPFLLCLPLAFAATALLGAVMERTLYRHMYKKPHLDQVLFSIGLAFMSVASVDYLMGSQQQIMQLPDWLRGRTELWDGALGMGHYRLFIIAVCAALTLALQYVLSATRFGSRLRASVDDPRAASGLGINVNVVFAATFAVGSGLAGSAGGASATGAATGASAAGAAAAGGATGAAGAASGAAVWARATDETAMEAMTVRAMRMTGSLIRTDHTQSNRSVQAFNDTSWPLGDN